MWKDKEIKYRFKEDGTIDHKSTRKLAERSSETLEKLRKLFLLNKKNPKKVNDNLMKLVSDPEILFTAYEKLKTNKGSMTYGTLEETADAMTVERIDRISNELRTGKFKWTDVRRQFVPKPGKKKKRPLGIPNFNDRIVQESIRIILNVLYEPVFQLIEANHGFRPKRSTLSAILKLQRETKEMHFALEGDIKGAYDHVNHKKMLEILKKKISDKKFLKLIEMGLKQNIIFEGKRQPNLLGTPQGGIASPILFNIYMNEFDNYILESLTQWTEERNKKEQRTTTGKLTTETRRVKSRVEKAKEKILKIKKEKETPKNKIEVRNLTKKIRINKQRMFKIVSTRARSRKLRFGYSRYADDFIIVTNGTEQDTEKIKNTITEWLGNTLQLTLDQDKTLITDLNKSKATYLGFTLYRMKKRIIRKTNKQGKIFRQRSTVELTVGVDHKRIKDRLIAGKIIDKNLYPTSNVIYSAMRPHLIVTKYRQRVEGLFNYYYTAITFPAELNFYHYAYKFSCLKTLARRMKMSIKKVTMKYGPRISIETEIHQKDSTGNKRIRTINASYPTYREITEKNRKSKEKNLKEIYKRVKRDAERKTILAPIEVDDLIRSNWAQFDPFDMSEIAVNLRSAYQLKTHCSVCGTESSLVNEIEQHHIKHIRKGKIKGFGKVMRDLNRKTIPVCKECHRKIHEGRYDSKTLKEIYDIELILS